MNKDTLIGIVGAAVLVAAMVGVFQYEQAIAAGAPGPADWALATAAGPGVAGATDLGAVSEEIVNVTRLNLTEVAFTLTWTAQNGADTLTLTVVPPEGVASEPLTVSGDSGTLELKVPVPNEKPTGAARTLGAGEWQVSVQFTSASGLAPQSPVPVAADASVSWSLATSLTGYEPAAA